MLYACLKPRAARRTGAKAGSAADLLVPHNSKGLRSCFYKLGFNRAHQKLSIKYMFKYLVDLSSQQPFCHPRRIFIYIGISGYKVWESSHLSTTALKLLIPNASEGYGEKEGLP